MMLYGYMLLNVFAIEQNATKIIYIVWGGGALLLPILCAVSLLKLFRSCQSHSKKSDSILQRF